MKQNSTTLSAPVRLHADLGGRIFENRKQAQKLAQDMVHLEAVIRMLAPDYDVKRPSTP
jgi:hypothetical protein